MSFCYFILYATMNTDIQIIYIYINFLFLLDQVKACIALQFWLFYVCSNTINWIHSQSY